MPAISAFTCLSSGLLDSRPNQLPFTRTLTQTQTGSHVIVMLDEDEAGHAGRDDIAARLAKFCFVKIHVFDEPNTQPEQLFAEDLAQILEGVA